MQKEALTKEVLTSLLKEAEKAHAEYEYALGHRDYDWATWYAAFIINRLQEGGDITSPDEGVQPTRGMIEGKVAP